MDVRQLRYFVGVLEAKSLSKAAGLLHVAQPALGVQIRNLERELGAKLLHRHARGIQPTEAGERLARRAGSLLREFDRVKQDLISYAGLPTGRVVLCIGRTLPKVVAANIAERCRARYPDIQLTLVSGRRQLLQISQEGEEADLVLTFRPDTGSQVVGEPLIQDDLTFVYSAKNGQLPREIDFCHVAEHILILPSHRHFRRQLAESAARIAGHELKIYCDIDSIETTKELVTRGVAGTLLPIAYVRESVQLGTLRVAKIRNRKLQRTLYLFHAARKSRSSAIDIAYREIRSTIMDLAQDESFGWTNLTT